MSDLSGTIQEALVSLLFFREEEGKFVHTAVPTETFSIYYKELVGEAKRYWTRFKKPPGEDHSRDLVEAVIAKEGKQDIFETIFDSMVDTHEGINSDYVLDMVRTFLKERSLKSAIVDASRLLDSGLDDSVRKAEKVLLDSTKSRLELFDPGTFLTDKKALKFLDTDDSDAMTTGIRELDSRGLGPRRRELHLFLGLPKRGKTWWFINVGKYCLTSRVKVCHVTLEMSETRIAQRYYQALFSAARRSGKYSYQKLKVSKSGRLLGMKKTWLKRVLMLDDSRSRRQLVSRMKKLRTRTPLIVKQFPTGGLTISELKAYLDYLELSAGFIPDLLIVDYADLMQTSVSEYRHSIGELYKGLRGIAVERNIAVATASQIHRLGVGKSILTEANVAEDFSKIATCDIAISFNQTEAEKSLGLARLFVVSARNEEDRFSVLITQSYATGQFCLGSAKMSASYWDMMRAEDDS